MRFIRNVSVTIKTDNDDNDCCGNCDFYQSHEYSDSYCKLFSESLKIFVKDGVYTGKSLRCSECISVTRS